MILGIAHIAIAVESLNSALGFWEKDLGLKLTDLEAVRNFGVKTAFLSAGENGNCYIELLQASSPDSAIAKFVKKRSGGGIHHIALLVEDIKSEIARLKSRGYEFTDPLPRPGAKGTQVAFLHPKSCFGVLVELVQEPHSPSHFLSP